MNILAIDIGGTKVALGYVSNGKLVDRKQIPTIDVTSAHQFANYILKHCQSWLADADSIGISTTGLVTEYGISAINPDTLSFPTPFPLHTEIETLTSKPVAMLNDAQAAAWYEYLHLTEQENNMAYITVSTGVGGGLVIDGKLHRGKTNFAGHIGHLVIDPNGPICGCGQQGCVEAVASGTAINKHAQQTLTKAMSNIALFEESHRNPKAEQIIQQSAQAIATLCCNLKASLDLDVIVIGGGIGLAQGYLERVIQHIEKRPPSFQIKLVPAKGNHDACLLGAAYLFEH
ncbi:N-acetylmannosamine kinase [Vibrio genomosp. F10]|uniref:N-acetylmannosamine kinase n=2 Tax=Vibrio genomosp. F10 TaxID=723171 RepID=A0A1B9R1G4_9VIBR|nr:N-acetylmannosamine kinase [Vibrio genomosp. F10]OCH77988.1 N-acetylmannosamine kinase [Vibrio genomosp. F10]OEE31923.1 N-acetylmannosamine kinase [Vibrio genomosp. F10 str. ZF-129]OEE94154.1 N-acetylmannosamine kinase [Vibrio genomosp. F10 str. 9ZC157]